MEIKSVGGISVALDPGWLTSQLIVGPKFKGGDRGVRQLQQPKTKIKESI